MAVITDSELIPRRRLEQLQARFRFFGRVFLALGLMVLVAEDAVPFNREVIDPPDRPAQPPPRVFPVLTIGGNVMTLGGSTATQ
jgi:hypothetical protein